YAVTFEVNGESQYFAVGPSEWSGGFEVPVLFASRSPVEAGAVERWASTWTGRGSGDFHFAAVRFPQLSKQWAAYTRYEWVVLSLEQGLPDAAALDAIFAWVRTGGRLLVIAPDPRAALESRPQDTKWLSPDYAVRESQPERCAAYHCGYGTITLFSAQGWGFEEMESVDGYQPAALSAVDYWSGRSWTPGSDSHAQSGMESVTPLLGGFGELPLRGLMVLLVVFALVMGPVNFWWVKRSRKPMLLLVTLPGISVVTSICLVLFGVFSQGLDLKVSTRSFTFLDQSAHQATTAEVRRIFAGSSPGAGMRPEAGTTVFPDVGSWSSDFRGTNLFTQDLTDGRLLGGDYLPVREPVVQLILSDRPTRLRLDVTERAGEVEVANAFDGPIERLLLRDSSGAFHQLNGALAAGESRRLVGGASVRDEFDWSVVMRDFWDTRGAGAPELPAGAYLAVLQTADLRDDCGVEVNEVSAQHVVFGVYAEGAER
ncbi:MAG: hypothetical protein KDC14_05170, partial [Planctomycetes bacterium]|nr:hypothetical protein [Planctomycetota bacterium]